MKWKKTSFPISLDTALGAAGNTEGSLGDLGSAFFRVMDIVYKMFMTKATSTVRQSKPYISYSRAKQNNY